MHILITNLHKHAPAVGQQFPRQQQAVAQIGQVGMDAQFPGVPESFDHLRLLGQVLVLFILHIPLVHKGLEVRAVLDAVGRVDVDHLHLSGHALLLQQGVHDDQAVARNHPVRPVNAVLIKLNGLPAAAHPLRRSLGGK